MAKIAVGSDERTGVTDYLIEKLGLAGHDLVLIGSIADGSEKWPDVGFGVADEVAKGNADQGIVCCWTGTGVSIAANKVPGIRAALCGDAATARGARRWNDANVLCLSLRLTTQALVDEILEAWFSSVEIEPADAAQVEKISGYESVRRQPA